MVRIPIHRKGQPRPQRFALVDARDAQRVGQFVWTLDRAGYVHRQVGSRGEPLRKLYLHREIMGLGMARDRDDDLVVDHRNRDPLDNRRKNLRIVTRAQNNQNRHRRSAPGSSQRRGVHRLPSGRYQALGGLNGRTVYLGSFDTESEAAAVAKAWRREHLPYAMS